MRRPPGPKPHFLIGNMPLASSDSLQTFLRWSQMFGDVFYYRAIWLHVYFLNDPDLIEWVLIRNSQNFLKDRVVQNSRWFFGKGLLTNEGDSWLRQRRLSQPAFHRERVASYARVMTAYTEEMLQSWRPGETRDIHQDMMQLTLRVVVRCLFNVEAEKTDIISSAMNLLMHNATGARMLLPPIARYLPTPSMIALRHAVGQLEQTVYDIIAARRASSADSGDLLSMLMNVRDEDGSGMSDKQLRDEVLTFLLAGHETTALALSWTWYLLSKHPEIEQKLHAELHRVLGGRSPEFADLSALAYTDRVIKESMRLYPPAWSLARTAIEDFELRGYKIPAGANIVMSQWIMHRNPKYFPDPEKFNPDRWLDPAMQKLPRFVYFPFGGGPRQCIGNMFALMETTLLLATMAQRFQLRILPDHPVIPVPSFTLRPKHGMKMTLTAPASAGAQAAAVRSTNVG
ncbi:MAG TPA: cytochrome P450 [Terriglobales bacterium]|nr:cytochrome P450 [Terriglobales bacterium]